jgi:hypothetical protein
VAVSQVEQIAGLRNRLVALAQSHEAQKVPLTATGLEQVRQAQERALKMDAAAITATDRALASWQRVLPQAQSLIEGYIELEQVYASMESDHGTDPTFIAHREDTQRSVLEMLNKVLFPFVDVSLYEVKALSAIVELAEQRQALFGDQSGDYLAGYKNTLEDYIRNVGDSDGLFGAIFKGLLGADPAKSVAKFVVGGLLVVGAVGLGIYGIRRALSAGSGIPKATARETD